MEKKKSGKIVRVLRAVIIYKIVSKVVDAVLKKK